MILNEIKDLIKDLEEVLIKDKRFKDHCHFKNQIKIIYKNNLNNFYQPSNIDITPLVTNLMTLPKLYKPSEPCEKCKPSEPCEKCKPSEPSKPCLSHKIIKYEKNLPDSNENLDDVIKENSENIETIEDIALDLTNLSDDLSDIKKK